MTQYAIMRCKKLSGMGSVAGALKHCYRERETPNADPERTPANEHAAATSTDQAMGRMRALLPEKRRRDAVLAVEYLMTASPEWWHEASRKQQDEFFQRARKWLADKYGADRIITATVHRDETSPHLSAFVVPLTRDGRLSAREFVGGRQQMRNDQTSFAAAVADLGLSRGIEGSKARHQTIREHYAALKRPVADLALSAEDVRPRVLRKGVFSNDVEAPETVAERLTAAARRAYAPAVAQARQGAEDARRADYTRQTCEALEDERNGLRDDLKALRGALAPFLDLRRTSERAFSDALDAAKAKRTAILQERKTAIERDRRSAEFQELAARRGRLAPNVRDERVEWLLTPKYLCDLIDSFNEIAPKERMRSLDAFLKKPGKFERLCQALDEREQNLAQFNREQEMQAKTRDRDDYGLSR